MDNFLIIRLSSLGDIIHTLPAFSALRKNFPKANISWIVEEKGNEILDLVPGIDRVIVAQAKGLRPGTKLLWAEISRLRKELKRENQTALDFQGLVKSGFFALLSGARKRVGFHPKNLREPLAALFYTTRLEPMPETIHVIAKNLKLLTKVGIAEDKYDFPLALPEEAMQAVRAKLRGLGYDGQTKLVVYNVGAAWETKRWFAKNWIRLMDMMKGKNFFSIILWGNEPEKALAKEIHDKTHIPLSPYLSLKEVMALVKQASLLISGDTFALQVACAFSRPLVGIFGPTNPRRNGPFREQDRAAFHEIRCSYCYRRKCSSLECLKKITPEEVAALGLQLLEGNA